MMDLLIGTAWADSASPIMAADPGLFRFVPIVGIFAVFYFFLIWPEQRKQEELTAKLNLLEAGDTVITAGGIHATIISIDDDKATAEIAPNVRVTLARWTISDVLTPKTDDKKAAKAAVKNADKAA